MKSLVAICALFIVGLSVPNQSVAAIDNFIPIPDPITPGECVSLCDLDFDAAVFVHGNIRDHAVGQCGGDPGCEDMAELIYELSVHGADVIRINCTNACLEPPQN